MRRREFIALFSDGLVAGQNLVVDDRGFGLRVGQLAEHASAIVKAQVDVINAGGDPPVRAAQQATKEIPILGIAEDMVGSRLRSGDRENPLGSTHTRMRVFDWDPIRAEH